MSNRAVFRVLDRIRNSKDGRLTFYWQPYFQSYEEDTLEPEFRDFEDFEVQTVRSAISFGYLKESIKNDEHHPDDHPDGETSYVKLTGSGFEYLNNLELPWYKAAVKNVLSNLWTIAASVIVTWAIFYFGAPK